MDRASSVGSASDAGSAFSGRSAGSRGPGGGKGHGSGGKDAAEELGQQEQFKKALFGALYTLAKEKINDTAKIAYIAIIVDFLLIFFLFIMPEYPWSAPETHPIFKIAFYIEFHLPIAHTGYRFYLIVFYILVGVLFASTAICVWVGWCFKNDSFPFLWPIKVARIVVSLFVSMFYIASLNIFLICIQCVPETGDDGKRHWMHLIYHKDCLALPHVVHGAFSLVCCVLFFGVALLLVIADHELEPMSHSLLAAPHSMCEIRMLLLKTVITVADIMLRPLPHYQVVVYATTCTLMLYYQLRWAPHLSAWINCFRAGLNAILAWTSFCVMVLTFSVHWEENHDKYSHAHWKWYPLSTRQLWTNLMAGGLPIAFLVGMGAMFVRLFCAWRVALKFAAAEPGARPRSVHTFFDDFDVEVAARIMRVFDAEGVPCDPAALDAAETVLKAGVAMYPNSVYLRIVYSNFLIEVRKNNSSGWAQLAIARKLEANLSYQFSIFSREQEHKQRAAGGGSGEQAVDLVSYVEFQKNYRSLLVYHKAALEATRDFWRLVMRNHVPMSAMAKMFALIDNMEHAASSTYRLVLDRYPKNAKLLRSYGRFLENVKNDPWGAEKYYAEAEKQEELTAAAGPEPALADDDGVTGNTQVLALCRDKDSGVITANTSGIIQTVNKVAERMLGYKKGELDGLNLSVLMPPPFSARHDGYLKTHLATGKCYVLNCLRQVVMVHKEGYILPITIGVTRASGSGMESVFMGAFQSVAMTPGELKAWMLPSGAVLCVDQAFLDNLGFTHSDVTGKPLSSFAVNHTEVDSLLAVAAKLTPSECNDLPPCKVQLRHKYGGQATATLRLVMDGSESQRMLIAVIHPTEEARMMLVVDCKGRVLYANTPLATLLGYKLPVLRSKDLAALMPPPYDVLHSKWLKDADVLDSKQTPSSCRNGVAVHLLTCNGTPVPVKAAISHLPGTATQAAAWTVTFVRASDAAAADERRLLLRVAADGTIVGVSSGTPASLFGIDHRELLGTGLEGLLDIAWHHVKAGGELTTGLMALLLAQQAAPDSSWRVGVGRMAEHVAELERIEQAASSRITLRQLNRSSARGKLRPAVMTVALVSRDEDGADSGRGNGGGGNGGGGGVGSDSVDGVPRDNAAMTIALWRADLLAGTLELGPGCTILRADAGMGLLLGVNPLKLLQHHLHTYLELPASTDLDDLMGMGGPKKGGIKKAAMHRVGPRHTLSARHPDGRPLTVTLQAVIKDATGPQRLVAAIKLTQGAKGAQDLMAQLLCDMQQRTTAGGTDNRHLDGGSSASSEAFAEQHMPSSSGKVARRKVPGLPLAQLTGPLAHGDGGVAPEALGMAGATHRSSWRVRGPATARGVELVVDGGVTARGGRGAAALQDEDEQDEEQAEGRGARSGGGGLPRGGGISEDGSVEVIVPARGVKHAKALTEEEQEERLAAKGRSKAAAWLESGFAAVHKGDDGRRAASDLPGVVVGAGSASAASASEAGEGPERGGAKAVVVAEGPEAVAAAGRTSMSDATSGAGDGTQLAGNFARGKRLRKLMRVLSNATALRIVRGFRLRMMGIALGVLLLHMAAFGAMVALLARDEAYVKDLGAAGKVPVVLHRMCTYARIIEAAQRGYGHNASDMAKYGKLLTEELTTYEHLHQGLYLGFGGLRPISSPATYELWHSAPLAVVNYDANSVAANGTNGTETLFNLGQLLVAAAQDVAYAGEHSVAAPLASNPSLHYLLVNGPGVIHYAYIKSLNLMALRVHDSMRQARALVLGLLLAEGVGVSLSTVACVVTVLRSLMAHRAALFSVFLALPNAAIRALASKSVAIGDEDEDSDEEEAKKVEREAAERKRAVRAAARDDAAEGQERDQEGDGGGAAETPRGQLSGSMRRKVMIQGDTAGGNTRTLGKGALSLDALMSVTLDERQALLFNGKQLQPSRKDTHRLLLPFLLWGALVMALYGAAYAKFAIVQDTITTVKLGYRSQVHAARVVYYAGEVALNADELKRAAMQQHLAAEAALLDRVYSTHLYGGPTLNDSQAVGSKDTSEGALFRAPAYADLLFRTEGCLRADEADCAPVGNALHAVTHAGIDALMRRLLEEADLLARDNTTAISPQPAANPRYAFISNAAVWDLNDGLTQLVGLYNKGMHQAIASERTVHIVLLLACVMCMAVFLVKQLRPFVLRVTKEGRRVAELLVQLPANIDLDTLVAALTDVRKAAAQPRPPPPAGASGAWRAFTPGAVPLGGWPPGVGLSAVVDMEVQQQHGGPQGGDRMFTPRAPATAGASYGGPPGGDGMRRRVASTRRVAPDDGDF